MADKNKDKPKVLKSIKVDENVWKLVKDHKGKTYLPIGVFFEEAAMEKLQKLKK